LVDLLELQNFMWHPVVEDRTMKAAPLQHTAVKNFLGPIAKVSAQDNRVSFGQWDPKPLQE